MRIRRVALIFDDRLRPDTAGVCVRRALAGLVEVVHFPPEPAEAIPRTGFDLYLSVDDDTEHRLPDSLHPRGYWAIDTHLDFAARLRWSVSCDLVFAAQCDGAERLRAAGIESAIWLPLTCDPGIHRKHDVPKQYDVAFVGHIVPGARDELLRAIVRDFPRHFIGRAFFDEIARIYSASRVAFNRSLRNDVNMRVFEALACGAMLVTNDLAGVQDTSTVPITIIANPRNVGFPAAINQGLQAASGECLVLLNNDAVVTERWQEHLIRGRRLERFPFVPPTRATPNATRPRRGVAADPRRRVGPV